MNITYEVVENALKAYKAIPSEEPLAKVTIMCLEELLKYKDLGTVKEIEEVLMTMC